jgi:tripartite-type tricarboxylate transporter receptor subunit TctC
VEVLQVGGGDELVQVLQAQLVLRQNDDVLGEAAGLAALGPQRLELLPDVPTVAESGYPGFDMGTWFAFLAPAGLPAPVQRKLEKALADVMASAELKKKMLDLGLTPAWGNGEALRSRVERELPLMRAVAARADIRVD